MLLDTHSHILPSVDDGAENLEQSLKLLKIMASQGITDVIATPHFYATNDNLEEFIERVSLALKTLKEKTKNSNLPNIYLGCEVFYFKGLSRSEYIQNFTINNSKYILVEPNPYLLNDEFFWELFCLKENGFIPIIAHIERYSNFRNFKKLIKFVEKNKILTQVNASSFLNPGYNRTIKMLVKKDIITFLGTDTHSLEVRPPQMKKALEKIEVIFGMKYKLKLIKNSNNLYSKIINKD